MSEGKLDATEGSSPTDTEAVGQHSCGLLGVATESLGSYWQSMMRM